MLKCDRSVFSVSFSYPMPQSRNINWRIIYAVRECIIVHKMYFNHFQKGVFAVYTRRWFIIIVFTVRIKTNNISIVGEKSDKTRFFPLYSPSIPRGSTNLKCRNNENYKLLPRYLQRLFLRDGQLYTCMHILYIYIYMFALL